MTSQEFVQNLFPESELTYLEDGYYYIYFHGEREIYGYLRKSKDEAWDSAKQDILELMLRKLES